MVIFVIQNVSNYSLFNVNCQSDVEYTICYSWFLEWYFQIPRKGHWVYNDETELRTYFCRHYCHLSFYSIPPFLEGEIKRERESNGDKKNARSSISSYTIYKYTIDLYKLSITTLEYSMRTDFFNYLSKTIFLS